LRSNNCWIGCALTSRRSERHTEEPMAFKAAFLNAVAPHDDDRPVVTQGDLASFLRLVDLLSDPKKTKALAADGEIAAAEKAQADLVAAREKAEDGIAAAKVEVDRLYVAHGVRPHARAIAAICGSAIRLGPSFSICLSRSAPALNRRKD
jgi:hypothetical protein